MEKQIPSTNYNWGRNPSGPYQTWYSTLALQPYGARTPSFAEATYPCSANITVVNLHFVHFVHFFGFFSTSAGSSITHPKAKLFPTFLEVGLVFRGYFGVNETRAYVN